MILNMQQVSNKLNIKNFFAKFYFTILLLKAKKMSSSFFYVSYLRFPYLLSGASDDFAIAYGNADFAYTLELPGGGPNGFDYPQDMIHDLVKETFIGYRQFPLFIKERFKSV